MTANQTIDGVPRELLASFAAYVQDSPNAIMRARVKELRALLDEPAAPVAPCAIADALESAKWPNTSIGNKVLVAAAITELRKDAQPHGEPVAWIEPDFKSDENALYIFSKLMAHKLAKKSSEGRSGWQGCSQADLTRMLREHVEKGDPVDVANFCMMLRANGMSIGPAEQPAPVAVVMSFDFEHPSSKERHTVALSKQDVFDGMEDYFYDKLGEQICRCEQVGETNVVDCSCDEYVHDFEIVKASLD